MTIKQELIKREIAGDVILVPVGKTALEHNGLFVLNELGAFLWDRLADAPDENALVQAVLGEYEVSQEDALRDIRGFLDKLRSMDIL